MASNQFVTKAIVLSRIDYHEADRILTVLTPEHGKLSVIAKGVRRAKSKLAGGIELFTVNELTMLPAKGDLHTLVSSRLVSQYTTIISDIDRTMFGYEALKVIRRNTEDTPGEEYYLLADTILKLLNNTDVQLDVIKLVLIMRLLFIEGQSPNLVTDDSGARLATGVSYSFDFDTMCFKSDSRGQYQANHIKLLRISQHPNVAEMIVQVIADEAVVLRTLQLAQNLQQMYTRH